MNCGIVLCGRLLLLNDPVLRCLEYQSIRAIFERRAKIGESQRTIVFYKMICSWGRSDLLLGNPLKVGISYDMREATQYDAA